jgi:predicted MPP superfamily phosphohydrolase
LRNRRQLEFERVTLLAEALIVALALLGHAGLWNGLTNRLHGTGLERWTMKAITNVLRLVLVGLPAAYAGFWLHRVAGSVVASDGAVSFAARRPLLLPLSLPAWLSIPTILYGIFVCGIAVIYYPLWWRDRRRRRPQFTETRRRVVRVAEELGMRPVAGVWAKAMSRLPGNQFLELELVEHTLEIPRLPPQLDGLSLVHLTDLHISGRMGDAYYRRAMRLVAEREPDLLLVTGDICEHARHIALAAELIALAPARAGKFFVLGNHDLRTHDVPALRAALTAAGCEDLGGEWREVTVNGACVRLGGDERPWHGAPLDPALPGPRDPAAEEARIVLMHSPDRLGVARAADADLALAGHTHGGQIRLPWIGAIVCPCLHGLRYDAGLYYDSPTFLYVGRGLCSLTPVRLNCRPELTRLVLRCPPAAP